VADLIEHYIDQRQYVTDVRPVDTAERGLRLLAKNREFYLKYHTTRRVKGLSFNLKSSLTHTPRLKSRDCLFFINVLPSSRAP
jgi:hypothetical protein